MKNDQSPILIIGIQRSGSNLLRLMLNQLPCIAAPHPPHILERFFPLLPTYGDLDNNNENFALLVNDVCQLIELNPVPWEGVNFDRQDIQNRCRVNSLVAIFVSVYDVLAQAWGCHRWCCKSMANVYYLPQINEYLSDKAKYVWLYRDGRDVANSFTKAVVGEKHFYHLAQEWAKVQSLALKIRCQYPSQFFSLSYESLIFDPESTLKSLCNFLEVDYSPAMLDFHESHEALQTASSSSLWQNVTKPIIKENTHNFLNYPHEDEICIFEVMAGEILDSLNYERICMKTEAHNFTPEEIAIFDQLNQQRKQEVNQTMDFEDQHRREKQAALLNNIKSRQKNNFL